MGSENIIHGFDALAASGARWLALFLVLLVGCATHVAHGATPSELINVSGTVEKICVECDTVDLVAGGAVTWDVVTVRITAPKDLAGTVVSVEVLVEGDGPARKKMYPLTGHISFQAARAAIDARRARLHLSDIKVEDK
jgi:hypothetical protein